MVIEIGKRYKNIHTGRICKVLNKIFFNIQYIEEGDARVQYHHYKRFRKNWIEVPDETEIRGD